MTLDERIEALTQTLELQISLQTDINARVDRNHAKTEATLRRAIRLGVKDAIRQRRRNARARSEIAELRQLMKAFLERGGNGE